LHLLNLQCSELLAHDASAIAEPLVCRLLQTAVAVTTSDWRVNEEESKHSPKDAEIIDKPCSTSTDSFSPAVKCIVAANSLTAAPSVSSSPVIPNGFSVIKSRDELTPVELRISQTDPVNRKCFASSLTSCVQSLRSSVTCSGATSIPLPTFAPQFTDRLPVNCDVKASMSALDSLRVSRLTAAELFPGRNTSMLPVVGHSASQSANSGHRSVKAGSTWFPTEFQTSLDCGTRKKTYPERSISTHASSGSNNVRSSLLKQFVDHHPTRNVAALNPRQLSERIVLNQNGVSAAACVNEPATDQPMDLSIQRRKLESTRVLLDNATSEEPLDLSRPSCSLLSDDRVPRHPSHSGRQSGLGSKPPSGTVGLQNYCSRLLSGGYSVDSQILPTVASSSSFSPLVSFTSCGIFY